MLHRTWSSARRNTIWGFDASCAWVPRATVDINISKVLTTTAMRAMTDVICQCMHTHTVPFGSYVAVASAALTHQRGRVAEANTMTYCMVRYHTCRDRIMNVCYVYEPRTMYTRFCRILVVLLHVA